MIASMFPAGLAFAIAALALALVSAIVYLIRTSRAMRPTLLAAMAAAFAASYTLSLYQSYLGIGILGGALFASSEAILFTIAAVGYFDKQSALYYAVGIAAVVIIIAAFAHIPIAMLMQAFSTGSLAGIAASLRSHKGKVYNKRAADKSIEINRDLFQICSGIVLLLILIVSFSIGKYVVMSIVLIGYLTVSYLSRGKASDNALSRVLLSLERPRTTFGLGAVYLSSGAFLVISLVPDFRLMLFGLVALFIADSLATIVGLRIKSPRLPYNRRKSTAGSVMYFAALAIPALLFVGYYAVIAAAVLALIEGFSSRLDDNITVAAALVVISALMMVP